MEQIEVVVKGTKTIEEFKRQYGRTCKALF